MSAELIAVISVGVALAGLMLTGLRAVRVEVHDLRNDVGDLRERMARLEGLFEGFTGRTRSEPSAVPGPLAR
ncbi:MAG: hypothetical protein F4029_17115 [Gammaproteobacteria bacterium]|nr:hypothetical protein [Gammaproteobacteria bacterium]